jgi:Ca-activated chloride channel family protein
MRPQWGVEFVSAPRVGAEIMIALDVSRSMLAEDVAPNRLDRAKAEIRDLLTYLEGDQVGLIAFAGRASVLSPLTPDFGFLRLVLDNADVGSVRPGGTRLEQPIRKAVAGFGGEGDLSRVILLITDGEDHDSFPLDAAKEAAERGIRILAIGFGDENGSEIVVTDSDTGARTVLRDADGRPVRSRLDGELLREIAVVTQGAYVPAGTGVLDLESIFEEHVRPLMRGMGEERGQTIHKEGFQWAVLVALLALLASVALQSSRSSYFAALFLAFQLAAPGSAGAQPTPPAPSAETPDTAQGPVGDAMSEADRSDARNRLELPEDPREAYNRGLEALDEEALDDAERLLEAARSRARGDAELRVRATFNLAWVDTLRADLQMESDPSSALASLERAADWLREAVALRPTNADARRNLEIVLERALALSDALAEREPMELGSRLDALIEEQRGVTGAIRPLAEKLQQSSDPNLAEGMRTQFRELAVEERRILSQSGALAEKAGGELDSLESRATEELTPEDQIRMVQLEGVLHYLHRGRERVGQARSQLRRKQAERAHRRAAAALSELRRARDQLKDPVRVLDDVIRDASGLATETRALAAVELGFALAPASVEAGGAPGSPAWLTTGYLAASQAEIAERTLELHTRLAAGLEQSGSVEDPSQQSLLEQVAAAQPFVEAAGAHFGNALVSLEDEQAGAAVEPQSQGIVALIEAREHFLDLKRLIEVAYADQQRIVSVLDPGAGVEDPDVEEYGPALAALQRRNLDRVVRLGSLLGKQRTQLEATSAEAGEEAAASERQRLDLADGILAMLESAMRGAGDSLALLGQRDDALPESRVSAESARRGLEALRRLYFSFVEHIRDAAERQVELADGTEAASVEPAERRASRTGPLSARQGELASQTEQLAGALHQQSFADPAELVGEQAGVDEAVARELSEKLVAASELVLAASEAMESAAADLKAAPADLKNAAAGPDASLQGGGAETDSVGSAAPNTGDEAPVGTDLEGVRELQGVALQKLAEALALMEPPEQEGQQDPQSDPQQEAQEGQQEQAEQDGAPPPQPGPEAEGDPGQLLQAVRDREAERHRRQGERRHRGYDPVEKDW